MYRILLQTISLSFVTRYNRNLYTAWNCYLHGGNSGLVCACGTLPALTIFTKHLTPWVNGSRPHCTWNECLTSDICQYKAWVSTVQYWQTMTTIASRYLAYLKFLSNMNESNSTWYTTMILKKRLPIHTVSAYEDSYPPVPVVCPHTHHSCNLLPLCYLSWETTQFLINISKYCWNLRGTHSPQKK